jgi:hypothetical protein
LFFFPKEAAGAAHARQLRNDLERTQGWAASKHVVPNAQTGIDTHRSNALALFFVFDRTKSNGVSLNQGATSLVRVRDFLQVRRGISTGCNEFFVLTDIEARRRRIARRYLRPVLPTRISLPNRVFSKKDWDVLRRSDYPCWLLALPNSDPREFEVPIQEYLKEGIRRGLHATPTARGYRDWFSIPVPHQPPDVFVTYLFRGAPRFLVNDARVFHLTNILGGRFVPPIEDQGRQEAIIEAMNEEAKRWMDIDMPGREYKGGLRKIEPKELSMLPISPKLARLAMTDRPAPQNAHPSLFD